MKTNISTIRNFNREYLNQLRIFNTRYNENFTITETRILYELCLADNLTLKELSLKLHIDIGYASRILKKYVSLSYVEKIVDTKDKRVNYLNLTHKGRQIAEKINQFEDAKVDSILESLSEQEQNLFTHALSEALDILVPDKQPVFLIRTHKAGDLGMITHFHGKYYADKYGYSNVFEALVAKDFSDYILNFEEGKDIFYVVEKDGVVMGSLALQHRTDVSAQLRFFYLDSSLRGIGLGKKLMNYILSFARKTGYTHLDLWTHENLKSAHSIYKKAGFKIVERKVHSLWKENLEEQRWELYL